MHSGKMYIRHLFQLEKLNTDRVDTFQKKASVKRGSHDIFPEWKSALRYFKSTNNGFNAIFLHRQHGQLTFLYAKIKVPFLRIEH